MGLARRRSGIELNRVHVVNGDLFTDAVSFPQRGGGMAPRPIGGKVGF
jgi:hypothetical protein